MNWQALHDGLRAWVAARSGISVDDVVWAGEPEGLIGRPAAWLKIRQSSGAGSDEMRFERDDEGQPRVRITGNRSLTLSIRVRSRDASPNARPYALLERVRDALQLPSSQQAFAALGVGVVGALALVDLGEVRDHREETEAVLDLQLTAAADFTAGADDGEVIDTIERVGIGGSVTAGPSTIVIPDRQIPEEP